MVTISVFLIIVLKRVGDMFSEGIASRDDVLGAMMVNGDNEWGICTMIPTFNWDNRFWEYKDDIDDIVIFGNCFNTSRV